VAIVRLEKIGHFPVKDMTYLLVYDAGLHLGRAIAGPSPLQSTGVLHTPRPYRHFFGKDVTLSVDDYAVHFRVLLLYRISRSHNSAAHI